MGSLMKYSAVATKIRAMESRLLKEEDFERLAEMENIPQAVEYLSAIPAYKAVLAGREFSSVHRGDMERLMLGTLYYDFSKLYRFGNGTQKEILKLYLRKYEIAAVKQAVRRIFHQGEIAAETAALQDFLQKYTKLDLEKLAEAETIPDLLPALRDTDFQKALHSISTSKQATLFDCEMVLDLYYFTEVWKLKNKLLKGKELKFLTESFGTRIDLLNMTWIYRAKKYYKLSDATIYGLLIPIKYKLKDKDIRQMVTAEDISRLDEAVSATCYGRRFENLKAEELELFYHTFLQKIYADEKRKYPYSMAVVTGYLYEKEEEIRKLTTVLEGVRYGLPKEETLSYIFEK